MKAKKDTTVYVGLSGGVDSSVAAALLQREGFRVVGIYMKCWSEELTRACTTTEDERSARLAAQHLGIPFYTWNFIEEYKQRVVDYMLEGYKQGITPNPDMMCNKEIKFGLFFERARKLGADFVATGHYARIAHDKNGYHLLQGKDPEKDQSYFLSSIRAEVLPYIVFPVGEYHKSQVRQIAREFGLPNAERKDSQGICFVGKVDVADFLREHIPQREGDIVDMQGNVLGTHDGVMFYTVGQRHGMSLSGGPYYVVKKDMERNQLVVSTKEPDLLANSVMLHHINWLCKPARLPEDFTVRIRYRHVGVPAMLQQTADNQYRAAFQGEERAVTPGQFAVLYKGEEMVGGGVIQ